MPLPVRRLLVSLCLAIAATFTCPAARCEVRPGSAPGLTLEMSLAKTKVYQGEAVAVVVTLKTAAVMVRNVGYPLIDGAPVDFAVAAPPAAEAAQEGSVYRFAGELFPAGPGSVQVGPAHLECEVIEPAGGGAAFFGAAAPRRIKLASRPATVDVMALPEAGRPDSFSGAVGSFTLDVAVRPEAGTVGEPVTVNSSVRGAGNLAAAGCPQLSAPGLRSYPASVSRGAGSLECEQVIIPGDAVTLPALAWSYFDPVRGVYRNEQRTLPLCIQPAKEQAVPPPARLAGQPWRSPLPLLIGLVVALAIAAAGVFWRTRPERPAPPPPDDRSADGLQARLVRLEQSLAEGDVEKFYTELFATLQLIVGSVSSGSICSIAAVSADFPMAIPASRLFTQCDLVRYGRFTPDVEMMQADLDLLRTILRAHC